MHRLQTEQRPYCVLIVNYQRKLYEMTRTGKAWRRTETTNLRVVDGVHAIRHSVNKAEADQ